MKSTNGYLGTFSFDKDYPFHHSNRNALENKIYVALDHVEPFLPKKVEDQLRHILRKKKDFANEGSQLLLKTIASSKNREHTSQIRLMQMGIDLG